MLDRIETPRLTLRPFQDGDAAQAFAWFGEREAMRYSPNGPDRTPARTRVRLQVYQDHQRRHGFSKWLITERASGRPIGDAGLLHLPQAGEIELGYRLARPWWGQGLATEAAQGWVRHGLEVLGIPRLIAFAHPDNAASIRVLEKVDFSFRRMDWMAGMHAAVYERVHPRRYRPPTSEVMETPRLLLREMGMGDLDFLVELLAHPEVMRYYPACCTREESEDWLRRQQHRYARDGFGFWLVLDKESGQPVGQVGLMTDPLDGSSDVGLGYMLHRPFWGRGFATEAASASCDYLFRRAGHPGNLVCLVRPENEPSRAVACRLGLTLQRRTLYAGFTHEVFVLSRERSARRSPG
jgi:RimJ/RimL family protein N-acetyltransferase